MTLDDFDLKILRVLQNEARLSLRDIGAQVGMSAPAVSARIKNLEESGIIAAYRAILGPSHFALNIEAVIMQEVSVYNEKALIDFLRECPNVILADKITGQYGFMLRAAFEDVERLSAFIDDLNARFGRCQCSVVLKREIVSRSPIVLKEGTRK